MTAVKAELNNLNNLDKTASCFAKKYKPVALKVKPVLGTLPERFRITREILKDLLKQMSKLPERLLAFQSKEYYTLDWKEKLDTAYSKEFLWPEERKLMHWLIVEQNEAFAWDDTERGKFKEEFFLSVEIPMVTHIP